MLSVRVPASTSNLGAGFDCLGLALDLWLTASLVKGDGPPKYTGTLEGLFPAEDLTLQHLHIAPAGHRLEVYSDIPVGCGLGSSSAAIVAGIALGQLVQDGKIDYEKVFNKAAAAEKHPDNAAPATYGGFILAAGGPVTLKLHTSVAPAFAVPSRGVNTKKAREILPAEVHREVAVSQANRAAALVLGLERGDPTLIAFGMEDQLAVPHRRDLIFGFEQAHAAGMDAGAYGVTISGAGSALVAFGPKKKAPAIAKAMAGAFTTAGNSAKPLTPKVSAKGLTVVGKKKA